MKRDKLKQMLLLTCAAVVAVTITKVYFACSADDDWEGTPEYLMTHAPMQTRATTDAMGGGNSYQSCGIWCIAYLRSGYDMDDKYDYVRYKAEQLGISTSSYIQSSQMVTLGNACGVSLSNWVTNTGQGVPSDNVVTKLDSIVEILGKMPYNTILGFNQHYVIGKKYENDSVTYVDPNYPNELKSKSISEFGVLIY